MVGRGERTATVTTGLSSGVGCSRLYWTGETAVWFPGKLKGRLGVELEFGKELIGRPDVDFLALGLQFLRTLFLGGFLGPFAHDKQRGLFGDVFGYLATALGDALPQNSLVIGLEITGEGDMLAIKCAFRISVWIGLGDSIRRGDRLPGGGATGLLFCRAGRAGLVAEVGACAEVGAGGRGRVGAQDGKDGRGLEAAKGELAGGE